MTLLAMLAGACGADGSTITVVSLRSTIAGAQTVQWSQLGPAGTVLPQPFRATTNTGYQFTVYKNNATAPFARADEGNGFLGDFASGEALLYGTALAAIDLKFDAPIVSAGAQIQHDGAPFRPRGWTPFVIVKRSDGPDVSFVFPPDVNDGAEDGSAPFVGITSDAATITEVLFDSLNGGSIGMNFLTIAIPEPSCATSVLALAALCRRRRRRGV